MIESATPQLEIDVEAHEQDRTLQEHVWYPEHSPRTESTLFRKAKEHFHEINAPCFICGKRVSDGITIEIHHLLEWAFAEGLDMDEIKRDLGVDDIEDIRLLIPLCTKHHRGRYTGIHCVSHPVWYAQKYAKPSVSFTEHETRQMAVKMIMKGSV